MALTDAFFGDLGGAVSSIFGGIGALSEAKGYSAAAQISASNADITKRTTALNLTQANRQLYQAYGTERADTAGAGFQMSGSAIDLMKSSVNQGAITQQIIQNQGEITAQGYEAQASSYQAQSAAAKAKASGGFLSGVLGLAGAAFSLFSDRRLKEDIKLVREIEPGMNLYTFRYLNDPITYIGVMADEVAKVHPEAAEFDKATGFTKVNYTMLGVEFQRAA